MEVRCVWCLVQRNPLGLCMGASETILAEFKRLDEMRDAIAGDVLVKKGHALDRVLQILMKAGRIYLSACGEDVPPELPCRPADLIDVRDPKATQAIFDVMRSDTERTVEAEGKNGKPASDQ